jgi:DNA-3-methyladenine glycosylase
MHRLDRSFFARHAVTVAEELLGKILCWRGQKGLITETEAYRGEDDAACHAFRGLTPRTKALFGPPGCTYVYFVYGMHFCLNIVAEPEGVPAGVLLRGLFVPPLHANGPGKLCRFLGITKADYGIDLIDDPHCYVQAPSHALTLPFLITPRIGIRLAQEKPWRFMIAPEVNLDAYLE